MSLTPRKKILLKKNEINDFLLFSKLIFNTRRKKIKNCINLGDEALYDNIEKRAEELSIEEMIKLYRDIKNDGKSIQN
jgi:16S rRNA A1518/A1519 N6-dimethyltransferase RsmA/KsgA/DIM1 with predicted DNA glycosylase/AP lyase activity